MNRDKYKQMRIEHQILLIKYVTVMLMNNTITIVYYSVMREVLSHHPLKDLHNFTYPYCPLAQYKSKCSESWAYDFGSKPDEYEKLVDVFRTVINDSGIEYTI